jgi:uncharacterized protein DUF2877
MRAVSISPFAAELLSGPPQLGVGVGHGYVLIGRQVVALTPPGRLRMPNGVETELDVANGERVFVGDGALRTASGAVILGPIWDPRPHPRIELSLRPRAKLELAALAGRGPGLTPLGDDILVGYLAAAALAGDSEAVVAAEAACTDQTTTNLSRTLLRLAARGALPEAAHRLLVDGDPEPLLAFGATSGKGIAFGLALFGAGAAEAGTDERVVRLGESGFALVIGRCRGAAAGASADGTYLIASTSSRDLAEEHRRQRSVVASPALRKSAELRARSAA